MNNSHCDYVTVGTGGQGRFVRNRFLSFTKSLQCPTLLSFKNGGWDGGQEVFHVCTPILEPEVIVIFKY